MPRAGSGVYSLPAGNPVVDGTPIATSWANATLSDIATALTESWSRTGAGSPAANLPMGGFKFTGMASAAAAGEALVQAQTGAQLNGLASTGNITISVGSLAVNNGGATFATAVQARGVAVPGGVVAVWGDTAAFGSTPVFAVDHGATNDSAVAPNAAFAWRQTVTGAATGYTWTLSTRRRDVGLVTEVFAQPGQLMVGPTSVSLGPWRYQVQATTGQSGVISRVDEAGESPLDCYNASGVGDNLFARFREGAPGLVTIRGSIAYNRAGGLTAYNTTSDYRAKTLTGVYGAQASGTAIDAMTVRLGKMTGASIERPMFVAHELQVVAPYAVTGEKDAVHEDGSPMLQQVDHSSLVPMLVAELQYLRRRVAALEGRHVVE